MKIMAIDNRYGFFKDVKLDDLTGALKVKVVNGGGSSDVVMSSYATANRPAHNNGLVILDTDLGYPIYSDGTNWKNFSGQIV